MRYERIYFFGDSITLGCNDSTGLGWPGRLTRGLMHQNRSIACYNLGINGDTSLNIRTRWKTEIEARRRDCIGLIVFAFGFNDAAKSNGAGAQVDLETSTAAARAILTEAKSISEVLWIGPTPLDESVNPMLTDYASWEMTNADIGRYDEAYANLADQLGVNYLRLFPDFMQSPRYRSALLEGDKVHPADDGYAMIAEYVGNWNKWRETLQIA